MDISADTIRQWHLDKGWSDIGYHYVITRSGDIQAGREESLIGAHARGVNANSVGVCLVGGVDANSKTRADCNFAHQQWAALKCLVHDLLQKYPNAKVAGHRDFARKACPTFDVEAWFNNGVT